MSRADSPLKDHMIFVVGSRRSGTHWLQRIVCAHPHVAGVPSETHLFSDGVRPLVERFHHGARGLTRVGFVYADEGELLDATRDFCDRMLGQFREPGRPFLVERTPWHVFHLELITRIYPDARVAHIVRDGRDVARSLVSQTWGPPTIAEAADEWRTSVVAGRRGHDLARRYVEVRYEDLLAAPERTICQLYEGLGLEASPEAVRSALIEARVQANLSPTDSSVGAGKWRDSLSRREVSAFERVAGLTMAELGYAPAVRDASRGDRVRIMLGRLDDLRVTARRALRVLQPRPDVPPPSRLVSDFLACVHARRLDDLSQLVREDALVEIVDEGGRRRGRGADGLAQLTAALQGDAMTTGRQLRGEVFPGSPLASAVLTYELRDGTRADRVLLLSSRAGGAAHVVLHRLSARPGISRPSETPRPAGAL